MNVRTGILGLALTVLPPSGWGGEAVSPSGRSWFENRIRPVLAQHCYECHSADAKKLGGKLRLDNRAGWSEGGESGPALVPGAPEKSLILQALRWEHDLEMPPEEPVPESVIRDFSEWVRMGAPDPRTGDPGEMAKRTGDERDPAALWSFQPVENPPVPKVADTAWPRDPLDHFVLAPLEETDRKPAGDASADVLFRRLSFDLTGLPPERGAMQAFVADHQRRGPDAVADLVDTLLASPQFGVRWGRHWLDVARYGESNGNDGLSRNASFPHAWRYRNYVIEAFNANLPYDRFLTEQIAGDLLPADSPAQRDRHLVATGFLALGAKPAKAMNNNFAMDVVADQIDVVGRGIMGLSVGCARCHDHKFDPIPTRDYYALAGIFTSSETLWGVAANEKLTAPATDLHVLQAAPRVPPPADFVETVLVLESNTGKPKPVPKPKWEPGTPLAMGMRDRAEPADCQVNLKGDAKKLGEAVPRGFLTACGTADTAGIDPAGSGRLELARWLVDGRHPQTARVMVNRVWLHLFGEGLVRTPDDFGVYGDQPTHPDLLDHVAARFSGELGWSVKRLIRAIVLSRTYGQDSRVAPERIAADPENLWLGRHLRRRLDAESLRDAMLAVSGELILEPAEGSLVRHRDILVNLAGNLHEPSRHRSIYLCYLRNAPPPELVAFDLPSFTAVTGRRDVTIVPGQALYLFNAAFVVERAAALARGLPKDAELPGRVRHAYLRALQREPAEEEARAARELVRGMLDEGHPEAEAWASFCQALLSSNEFRYID